MTQSPAIEEPLAIVRLATIQLLCGAATARMRHGGFTESDAGEVTDLLAAATRELEEVAEMYRRLHGYTAALARVRVTIDEFYLMKHRRELYCSRPQSTPPWQAMRRIVVSLERALDHLQPV